MPMNEGAVISISHYNYFLVRLKPRFWMAVLRVTRDCDGDVIYVGICRIYLGDCTTSYLDAVRRRVMMATFMICVWVFLGNGCRVRWTCGLWMKN